MAEADNVIKDYRRQLEEKSKVILSQRDQIDDLMDQLNQYAQSGDSATTEVIALKKQMSEIEKQRDELAQLLKEFKDKNLQLEGNLVDKTRQLNNSGAKNDELTAKVDELMKQLQGLKSDQNASASE